MTSCKSTRFPQMGQGKRTREYSPSKNAIYSPLAVEDDQKQIIIARLKDQIELLEKNGNQFGKLKEHYKKLEHQYNLLFNQKKTNDNAFAKHHEAALKEICIMKNEMDSIKLEMRQKKLEVQDLTADQNTLHNQLDQKQIQIEKIKNDLRSCIADNDELGVEREKLNEIYRNIAQQRQRRADECQKLKFQIDKVQGKIQELTKYQLNLQRQEKALTQEIIKFEELNNKADEQISVTCEDIAILDGKIEESQVYITDLQRKIAQSGGLSEKYKNDCLFTKKSVQSQIMKNNETVTNIQQTETLLNVRVNQVKEGHRQLDVLNEENISLEKINTQLQDDLEACKRHLENLALLNSQLVKNMQVISEEDEQARDLIDRGGRVQRASERVKKIDQSRRDLKISQQTAISSSRYTPKRRFY